MHRKVGKMSVSHSRYAFPLSRMGIINYIIRPQ